MLLIGTPEAGPHAYVRAAFYAEIAKEFRVPYEGRGADGKILRDAQPEVGPGASERAGYRLMAERVYALLKNAGAL